MFEQAGLPAATALDKVPISRRALMLGELARDRGVFHALHPRLFHAYWARGCDLGDDQVLREERGAVSLDPDEITAVLQDGRYLERIEAETRTAVELGAGGGPAWLVDERLLVPGAQPHDVFAMVLERLGHAPLA